MFFFFVRISSRLEIQICHCGMALRQRINIAVSSYMMYSNLIQHMIWIVMYPMEIQYYLWVLFRKQFFFLTQMWVCMFDPNFVANFHSSQLSQSAMITVTWERTKHLKKKNNHDKILDNRDCTMIMNRRDMLLIVVVTSPWLLIKAWLDIDRLYGIVAD